MSERSPFQLAAWAVAAILVVVAGGKLLGADRGAGAAPAPVRVERPGAGGSGGGHAYVHVAGEVRRPGLYRVPVEARVAAALERAGGPTRRAEVGAVNLAARVEDGQQIVVPHAGARPAEAGGPAGGAGGGAAAAPPLSLASATADQLEELDGIGPTLAKRIIEYRDAHGGFRSLAQLREVEGIGPKRFEALKKAVRP